ncbi:hypothetical protein [Clavibacter sp. km1a]|uniref:hypothetical protein n=1 Tax=Clavibacter sp. km1a TaxID=3459136 RepID=UPI004042C4F2
MRMSSRLFVVATLAVVSLTPADAASASDAGCSSRTTSSGACAAGAISGASVQLTGSAAVPRSASGDGRAASSPDDEGSSAPVVPHPVPRQDRLAADVDTACRPGKGTCLDGQHAFLPPAQPPVKPADPAPVAPAGPGVTLEDVAQFVPRSASIRSQPNGWALVGAPVNLLTDATPQVVDGTLLGRPAQVRFVPVSFTWDHGDGTSTTVEGPGASWRQLGQQDFSPTDTSHVYPSVGDRQISLTIAYSPSYRFDGGGWQQIPGVLPVLIGPVTLHVLQGSTVLVGGACGSAHAGPGC